MKAANQMVDWFREFKPNPASPHPLAIQKTLFLARRLQERAGKLQTPSERRQQAELDRLLQNPADKATLVQMTDQAFRPKSAAREVDQLIHILDVQGVPRFFSSVEKALLRGFQSFGGYLPGVAAPLVKERMQKETANVILPAEMNLLREHLRKRREQGIRMNVNFLGEAILSEADAERRLEQYLEALQDGETEVFSVKISTLYSQINPLAREHTLNALCDRLALLYRTAARARFERADGTRIAKFIYLDMEEYRDMWLTAEAFMRTLDRPGLENVRAGMALQAYLPDSFLTQQRLNDWARQRVAKGGSHVTIRIVKGANMEMERVEAVLKGWPQAPFPAKLETDANFKRMLQEGMRPDNLAAVRIGIASHNLFDLAYGLVLAHEADALDHVQFEMLEGMANHTRRALFELANNLLLYSPVCHREDFLYAIGYLIRRLDENTGPENFLRHAFKLAVDSPDWHELEDGFLKAFALMPELSSAPRRRQNRNLPPAKPESEPPDWTAFSNEPDTDWSLPHNVEWAESIIQKWQPRCGDAAVPVPLVVGGKEVCAPRSTLDSLDPSRPGMVVARYVQANSDDVKAAITCAVEDADGWRKLGAAERQKILRGAAREIRRARADLMGAAMAEGGKTFPESDPEVSEAVDFVEFYSACARYFENLAPDRIQLRGKGVVVVVSPWNFPIAIPCGGVAAALAAGNTVILKPASDTVLTACELCQCFWRAGVSRKTLQFLPCAGSGAGEQLVTHPQVDAVILTGGTETALRMLKAKAGLPLSAETGGKNATIVTAMADRDQAIKHVLHSAFSHSGQKCSATSLLLLEAEVYDDPDFKRALCEAIESLPVGSAWDMKTRIGPLIRPPAGDLETALKTLEPGESWALLPRHLEGNPNLWTPGVKWDVQPGSLTHLTEFFGPVLGVMRFSKLAEAIALVNQTGYGLTSGLESLDDREQAEWRAGIKAGNLYLNRATVGAIVLRQPFGGFGQSAFGPGLKAGGPNYVTQFMRFAETAPPPTNDGIKDPLLNQLVTKLRDAVGRGEALTTRDRPVAQAADEVDRLIAAIGSYDCNAREEFGREHDHFRLLGQDNLRRYLPLAHLRIRVHPGDAFFDIFARACAARAVGCRPIISIPVTPEIPAAEQLHELTHDWAAAIEFVTESDEELARAVRDGQLDRIRFAAPERVSATLRATAAETTVYLADAPVLMEGRLELLWYVREQSISHDYHRYGNLGARADEERMVPE